LTIGRDSPADADERNQLTDFLPDWETQTTVSGYIIDVEQRGAMVAGL
jgi:hypothetical protein